jgi:hypothetical protein
MKWSSREVFETTVKSVNKGGIVDCWIITQAALHYMCSQAACLQNQRYVEWGGPSELDLDSGTLAKDRLHLSQDLNNVQPQVYPIRLPCPQYSIQRMTRSIVPLVSIWSCQTSVAGSQPPPPVLSKVSA